MRREGSTYSDIRKQSIHTNATLRRTDHIQNFDLPASSYFILPPGMTPIQALAKAQQARDAKNLLRYGRTRLHPSDIDALDQHDLSIIKTHFTIENASKNSPFTWEDLPDKHKSRIEELAKQMQHYYYVQQHPIEYAAYRIVDRHRKLDKEMLDLENLGFGSGRVLALLTKQELAKVNELAESGWAEVRHDNIFANEAAAEKALDRVKRKAETDPKRRDRGLYRRSELNPHRVGRVQWRSELAAIF
ncbi:hypothetical protein BDR26DRAFT_196142 [Obelidium mucronatum]|nr:hypothetical protein BDR26DRAFT_196142 [Obelidium mucronatum]